MLKQAYIITIGTGSYIATMEYIKKKISSKALKTVFTLFEVLIFVILVYFFVNEFSALFYQLDLF